jgi:hypothetical protein
VKPFHPVGGMAVMPVSGNVAVSTLPPLPIVGRERDDENVCGMSFRYMPALNTSYMPPRRNMYWSSRPKFSP